MFSSHVLKIISLRWAATSRTLRTTLKCVYHSAHIFRCSCSSRVTKRLPVDSGCCSLELCNPIQYCLACRNLSIPPDVKMSLKNTLRYISGIIVYKIRFHIKRPMLFRPTPRDDWRPQTALPSDVCFHRATYKDVGMALNLNRLIVSAPLCRSWYHWYGTCFVGDAVWLELLLLVVISLIMFHTKSSQFSFTFVICEQTSQFVRSSVNDTSGIYTCLSHTADCTIFVFHSLWWGSWPLVPKFARSNPAEAVGFLGAKKSSARLPSEGK